VTTDRNLQLTPTQRIEQLQQFVAFLAEAAEAGRRRRDLAGEVTGGGSYEALLPDIF